MTTWIYHITHLENLSSIIRQGGLYCSGTVQQQSMNPLEIGYTDLKDKRSGWSVPRGPGGTLSDYVPFYFAPRSPMLYAIKKGQVAGYNAGQRPIVHLLVPIERVVEYGLPFVFTDGHAIKNPSKFFDNLDDLQQVDWKIMKDTSWHDTPEDGDRKRRRQAEFLVHRHVPWELIRGIGVHDKGIAEQVRQIVAGADYQPRVVVRRNWYYRLSRRAL